MSLSERPLPYLQFDIVEAARNVPNFVDLETGGYGATIQDGLNSAVTPTMANFSTLATIVAGCTTQVAADACAKLFSAAASPSDVIPADTLAAVETIARNPAHQPERIFALLDTFYPVPKGKKLRPTPYMPYLSFAPSAWVFPLKFTGGGYSGGGKLMFDSQGNVWHAERFGVSERGRLKLIEMMAAFKIKGEKAATEVLVHNLSAQKAGFSEGGSVSVLRPDGSPAPFSPIVGKGLAGPWAVAVDLGEGHLERYGHRRRRRQQCIRPETRRIEWCAVTQLLQFLRDQGVCPTVCVQTTAAEKLVASFQQHLQDQQGLATVTIEHYATVASQFLDEHFGNGAVDLRTLCANDGITFIQRQARRMQPPALKCVVLRRWPAFNGGGGPVHTYQSAQFPCSSRSFRLK